MRIYVFISLQMYRKVLYINVRYNSFSREERMAPGPFPAFHVTVC